MQFVLDSSFKSKFLMYKEDSTEGKRVKVLLNGHWYRYETFKFIKDIKTIAINEYQYEEQYNTVVALSDYAYDILELHPIYDCGELIYVMPTCKCIGFNVSGLYLKENYSSKYGDIAEWRTSIVDPENIPINAWIELKFNIKEVNIEPYELITYAKYRWCMAFNLEYELYDDARNIELKLNKQGIVDLIEDKLEVNPYKEWIKLANQLWKDREDNKYEYYKTEHWKRLSKEARDFYQNKCGLCGELRGELNVHHSSYENVGRETFNDLILLCKGCHKKHHNK